MTKNTYDTDYIRERVKDIRAKQPEEPYGALEMAVMAAISYTAIKMQYNRIAASWGKEHPEETARAVETDSILDIESMISLYKTMMTLGRIGSDRPREQIPIPKTRDVHRYLSVINRVEKQT